MCGPDAAACPLGRGVERVETVGTARGQRAEVRGELADTDLRTPGRGSERRRDAGALGQPQAAATSIGLDGPGRIGSSGEIHRLRFIPLAPLTPRPDRYGSRSGQACTVNGQCCTGLSCLDSTNYYCAGTGDCTCRALLNLVDPAPSAR